MAGRVRLDRALSKLGMASRAEARRRIEAGQVAVNGRTVRDPAALVAPERVRLTIGGAPVASRAWRTVALHKPRGTVTTRRDPQGRATVFDVLGDDAKGLVAVGRLDLASTGLLLLTTDTRLAAWLTDPASHVPRRYAVVVRGSLSDAAAARLSAGGDGDSPASVIVRKRSRRETHLIIELTGGRNREIRRRLAAVGHEVTRLLRVAYGGVQLGSLQPGAWRSLTRDELRAAFPGCPLRRDLP